jgi:hypothetical protein
MPRFVDVTHREWIAAPVETVRAQFADLDHHIHRNVHPGLRFEVLQRRPQGARFLQEVRLLGIRQRDIFERQVDADGRIEDRAVEGFNRGGSLTFEFAPGFSMGRRGTEVAITIRLPLPPGVGALLRPLLAAQIRRAVRDAALEDKHDIEALGYPVRSSATVAA